MSEKFNKQNLLKNIYSTNCGVWKCENMDTSVSSKMYTKTACKLDTLAHLCE